MALFGDMALDTMASGSVLLCLLNSLGSCNACMPGKTCKVGKNNLHTCEQNLNNCKKNKSVKETCTTATVALIYLELWSLGKVQPRPYPSAKNVL